MLEDEKVAFYFRNRSEIEEWASLRTWATAALMEALVEARSRRMDDPEWPGLMSRTPWSEGAILPVSGLPIPGEPDGVGVGLAWGQKHLLNAGANGGPVLALITAGSKAHSRYGELKQATRDVAAKHRMTDAGDQYVWRTDLVAPSGEEDLATYADGVMEKLHAAWSDLWPVVVESLR